MKSNLRTLLPITVVAVVALAALVVLFPDVVRLSLRGQPSAELTFAVIGDTENHRDLLEKTISLAEQKGAEFILHTGDISDQGNNEELSELAAISDQAALPIEAVIGNHELRTDPTGTPFVQRFGQRNRVAERRGYRIVLIDNADRTVGFSAETLRWLEQELSEHPDARYLLVFHRPFNLPLGALIGDDETPASRRSNETFLSLISRADVRAIFTGHLHLYLPYMLLNVPIYVTGGGGGEPQVALGGLGRQDNHFLLVRMVDGQPNIEVVPLR